MEKHRLHPVIVGGLAVEIYSQSEYTTSDIDIIFEQRDIADQCFHELGFVRSGRHWYHAGLGISVEIPNDILDLADRDKVIKLHLSPHEYVYVIGVEDIILDRLRACVHRQSSSDSEWGRRLFLLHRDRLDLGYMQEKSKADGTSEILDTWTAN